MRGGVKTRPLLLGGRPCPIVDRDRVVVETSPMRQVRPAPVSDSPMIDLSPGEGSPQTGLPNAMTAGPRSAVPTESRLENALSVALMAGIAFLPIVIAAGFLAEHLAPSVPREVSKAAFRGAIDADRRATAEARAVGHGPERPAVSVRAGF